MQGNVSSSVDRISMHITTAREWVALIILFCLLFPKAHQCRQRDTRLLDDRRLDLATAWL